METNSEQVNQQKSYAWPNWNSDWGKPATILISPRQKNPEHFETQLNEVLRNLSKAAKQENATALTALMRDISGMEFDTRYGETNKIEPGHINRLGGIPWQSSPSIKYNPELWLRYPVEGTTVSKHASIEIQSADGQYHWPTIQPETFKHTSLAPPETSWLKLVLGSIKLQEAYQIELNLDNEHVEQKRLHQSQAEQLKREAMNDKANTEKVNQILQSVIPNYAPISIKYHDQTTPLEISPAGALHIKNHEELKQLANVSQLHPLKHFPIIEDSTEIEHKKNAPTDIQLQTFVAHMMKDIDQYPEAEAKMMQTFIASVHERYSTKTDVPQEIPEPGI